jgi:glycosyltransferase involved in cell wall biosynthesis
MSSPTISVIIPARTHGKLLDRTLECLAAQRLPPGRVEVVVSLPGHRDDAREVRRRYGGRLRLRCCAEGHAFELSSARNAGARMAAAPVLAFLNPGVLPGADYAGALIAAHVRRCAVTGYELVRARGGRTR